MIYNQIAQPGRGLDPSFTQSNLYIRDPIQALQTEDETSVITPDHSRHGNEMTPINVRGSTDESVARTERRQSINEATPTNPLKLPEL